MGDHRGNTKVGHKLIRRVSLDQFYALVTGQKDAFYQICMALPTMIQSVVDAEKDTLIPCDTVYEELRALAESNAEERDDMKFALAVFMLGFSSYAGFQQEEET